MDQNNIHLFPDGLILDTPIGTTNFDHHDSTSVNQSLFGLNSN